MDARRPSRPRPLALSHAPLWGAAGEQICPSAGPPATSQPALCTQEDGAEQRRTRRRTGLLGAGASSVSGNQIRGRTTSRHSATFSVPHVNRDTRPRRSSPRHRWVKAGGRTFPGTTSRQISPFLPSEFRRRWGNSL